MTTAYCIAGYPGAGKSAATEAAEQLGYDTVVMGDIARARAAEDLDTDEPASSAVSDWAAEQRAQVGEAYCAHLTVDAVTPRDAPIVIDGIRSPAELRVYEQSFDDVVLVAVEAPEEVRRERIVQRGRTGEDADTLAARDAEEERWGLDDLLAERDVTIHNEGSLDDLCRSVEDTLRQE